VERLAEAPGKALICFTMREPSDAWSENSLQTGKLWRGPSAA
jgi:hypothetical protein